MGQLEKLKAALDSALDLEWHYKDGEVGGISRSASAQDEAAKAARLFRDAGYEATELRPTRANDGWVVVFDAKTIHRLSQELADPKYNGEVVPKDFPRIHGGVIVRGVNWEQDKKCESNAIAFVDSAEKRDALISDLKFNKVMDTHIDSFKVRGQNSYAVIVPIYALTSHFPDIKINGVSKEQKAFVKTVGHIPSPLARSAMARVVEKDRLSLEREVEPPSTFEQTENITWSVRTNEPGKLAAVVGGNSQEAVTARANAILAELNAAGIEAATDNIGPKPGSDVDRTRIIVDETELRNAADITVMEPGARRGHNGGRRR